MLGKERFDHYLHAFGFGQQTALGFPGEADYKLLPLEDYNDTSMGSMPIGNGIAVSAIQMLDVYMTLANGGMARRPAWSRPPSTRTATVTTSRSCPTHRVVSPATAVGGDRDARAGGAGRHRPGGGGDRLPGGGQDRHRPQASLRAPALPVRRVVRRICAGERTRGSLPSSCSTSRAAPSSAAPSPRPRSPRSCSRRWARSASRRPREAGGRGGGPPDPPGSRTRSRRGRPVP